MEVSLAEMVLFPSGSLGVGKPLLQRCSAYVLVEHSTSGTEALRSATWKMPACLGWERASAPVLFMGVWEFRDHLPHRAEDTC